LDITGLSYLTLEQQGPQPWPFKEGTSAGARLYTDGVFQNPSGKAHFHNALYKATVDKTDARHPLHFLTGRFRDQWHGMSRTGTIAQLYNHVEEPVVSMNQDDMTRRQLKTGDIVKLSNKRGGLNIRVQQSEEVKPAETLASDWLKQVMQQGEFTNELRKWTLAPLSSPPTGQKSRGKIVCNCLDVSENEIIEVCQAGADLLTLQAKLKCGTNCASCVAELKRLVKLNGTLKV
jgi:anaerobic selenocysteine-containing dehydrogenase/bacterioferritin-associated ferredoxin